MDLFATIGLIYVLYLLVYVVVLFFYRADSDLRLAWAEKYGVSVDCLRGKVVWVTGASSGIGRALAIHLARHGAKLVLSARNRDMLLQVRECCIDKGRAAGLLASDVLVLKMDMLEIDRHQECFQKVIDHFGQLDVLVNNAGRSQRATWGSIEIPVDRQVFELNVFSVISLSRLALHHFLERGTGQLAVTSSVAGVIGVPFSGSYTGSKHAIHGYMESLRTEKFSECPGLQVTLLCPGPVATGFLAESFTNRVGERLGGSIRADDNRMTDERCAHLCAVALANRLDEAWIALFPIVPLVYVCRYFPNIARGIFGLMGAKRLQKLRDSRELVTDEGSVSSTSAVNTSNSKAD